MRQRYAPDRSGAGGLATDRIVGAAVVVCCLLFFSFFNGGETDGSDIRFLADGAAIRHKGSVNRVKVCPHPGSIVASWSDIGRGNIWDVGAQVATLENE